MAFIFGVASFCNSICCPHIVFHILDGCNHRMEGSFGGTKALEANGEDRMNNPVKAALGIIRDNDGRPVVRSDPVTSEDLVEDHFRCPGMLLPSIVLP